VTYPLTVTLPQADLIYAAIELERAADRYAESAKTAIRIKNGLGKTLTVACLTRRDAAARIRRALETSRG
jgi:hypothetical protein